VFKVERSTGDKNKREKKEKKGQVLYASR